MAEPDVTLMIVTLVMALILAKIFASRTLTNCITQDELGALPVVKRHCAILVVLSKAEISECLKRQQTFLQQPMLSSHTSSKK